MFPADATAKPLDGSASNSHSKVYVKSLEEIRKEKQRINQQQGGNLLEEHVTAPSAGEEPAAKKALVITSSESSVTKEKIRPVTKRVLVRSQEAAPDDVGSEELGLSTQAVERRAKAKPRVSMMKPSGVKATSPAKQALKRKASECHPTAIAAVKPLSPVPNPSTKELSSENMDETSALGFAKDAVATVSEQESCKIRSEPLIDNQDETVSSTSSPAAVRTHRLSSTGAGKSHASIEDDFDKLIWEISGGKLEAEIDLDPGKDEDDLLLELSEMIDS
uniref:Uncharacterized protein n=2 Tax=Sphaerodactylus townsendi TaxID=933632 RepID=A0ACB8F5D8_9SAUR